MAARHSRQTGRREICTKGLPQIRQSEGKRTEKRLSAIWTETRPQKSRSNQDRPKQDRPKQDRPKQDRPKQDRSIPDRVPSKAIEGPATAALAWIARIRSPLLLKTASVMPTKMGRFRVARVPPV